MKKGPRVERCVIPDDDMRLFARVLKDKGTPVPGTADKLTIKTGKNTRRTPSVASLYGRSPKPTRGRQGRGGHRRPATAASRSMWMSPAWSG